MTRLIYARCGMDFYAEWKNSAVSVEKAGSAVLESPEAQLYSVSRLGKTSYVDMLGGAYGEDVLGWTEEQMRPVMCGGSLTDPHEPLGMNIPSAVPTDLLAAIASDLTDLKQAVSQLNLNIDPGDLTPAFYNHL